MKAPLSLSGLYVSIVYWASLKLQSTVPVVTVSCLGPFPKSSVGRIAWLRPFLLKCNYCSMRVWAARETRGLPRMHLLLRGPTSPASRKAPFHFLSPFQLSCLSVFCLSFPCIAFELFIFAFTVRVHGRLQGCPSLYFLGIVTVALITVATC